MSIEAVKKVEIFPMNKSSNSNTWSPTEGTNVMKFILSGAEEKYLLTDSVALNFKLTFPVTKKPINSRLGKGKSKLHY